MHHIEPSPGDLMKRMAEPLSPSWLASQVGVTTQTVNRWKHGLHVTEERLVDVADALRRLLPEHKEALPPQWARGLADEILAAVEASGGSLLDRVVERLEARLGLPPRPDDGDAHEEDGAPQSVADTAGLPRQ